MAKQHSVTAFKVIHGGAGAAEPQPLSELRGTFLFGGGVGRMFPSFRLFLFPFEIGLFLTYIRGIEFVKLPLTQLQFYGNPSPYFQGCFHKKKR